MKILITGGAGYIGSHGAREFMDAGHEVRVIDNLSKGHRAAVPKAAQFFEGDLADAVVLSKALQGVDVVVHFAGYLSVVESVSQPAKYYRNNVANGLLLLDGMQAAGVTRIVFSSTCATFGTPVRIPIDETHPQDPINPYGASKRAFERVLEDFAGAGLLRAVALRYFNAAGCHPDGSLGEDHFPEEHLIPLAIDAALGRRGELTVYGQDYDTPDGTCVRDYIHVQDLARAHVAALAAFEREPAYQVYNLGSENGHSVREVIEAVGRVAGKPVPHRMGPRRAGDPSRLVASSKRFRETFGFELLHPGLTDIVATALRWRLEHPQGYRA